jgi:prevent-host-death family protein
MGDIIRNLYEAKTHLSELVERAAKGEEIVIAKNGVPMAKLVPLEKKPKRVPGCWEGKVWIADDLMHPYRMTSWRWTSQSNRLDTQIGVGWRTKMRISPVGDASRSENVRSQQSRN